MAGLILGYRILIRRRRRFIRDHPLISVQPIILPRVIRPTTTIGPRCTSRMSSPPRFANVFPSFDFEENNLPFVVFSSSDGLISQKPATSSPHPQGIGQLPPTFQDGAKLPSAVINVLNPYFQNFDLGNIRLNNGLPLFVMSGARAFTFGNNIYFAHNAYNPNTASGIALIGHEVKHSQQFDQRGTTPFLLQYGLEYLGGRLQGLDSSKGLWKYFL